MMSIRTKLFSVSDLLEDILPERPDLEELYVEIGPWIEYLGRVIPRKQFEGHGGRPRKYHIHKLAVGESTTIPWRVDASGKRNQRPVSNAICQEQRRFGKKFETEAVPIGLRVTRVK